MKIRVRCANCSMIYDNDITQTVCPSCGSNAADIVNPKETPDRGASKL